MPRGRPRKNGLKCVSMLVREFRVLDEYHRARRDGVKHSSAVKAAALTLGISESEIKQTLAKLQPQGSPIGFVAETIDSPELISPEFCVKLGIPEGSTKKNRLRFGFGPRPKYPRINAKEPEKDSSSPPQT